jgi:hypothetical protein
MYNELQKHWIRNKVNNNKNYSVKMILKKKKKGYRKKKSVKERGGIILFFRFTLISNGFILIHRRSRETRNRSQDTLSTNSKTIAV